MGSGTVAPQSVADAPAGAEQGFAGDGEQRPLVPRSRSSPRLKPSVRPVKALRLMGAEGGGSLPVGNPYLQQ